MQVDVSLHKTQKQVIEQRKRFNTIRCGRRWGKSTLAFALALETMVQHKGSKVLYTAPSNEELKGREQEAQQMFLKLGAECKQGEIRLGESILNLKPPQPEGGSRRDSFCARMEGMKKKLTGEKAKKDPNSRINKSLRAWNC